VTGQFNSSAMLSAYSAAAQNGLMPARYSTQPPQSDRDLESNGTGLVNGCGSQSLRSLPHHHPRTHHNGMSETWYDILEVAK